MPNNEINRTITITADDIADLDLSAFRDITGITTNAYFGIDTSSQNNAYFTTVDAISSHCIVCGERADGSLCKDCRDTILLFKKLKKKLEKKVDEKTR